MNASTTSSTELPATTSNISSIYDTIQRQLNGLSLFGPPGTSNGSSCRHRRNDYEVIPDNDDNDDNGISKKNQNRYNNNGFYDIVQRQCRRRTPFMSVLLTATCLLLATVWVTKTMHFSGNDDDRIVQPPQHHKETIPTMLSLIDPDTNDYIYSLDNELYDRIQKYSTLIDRTKTPNQIQPQPIKHTGTNENDNRTRRNSKENKNSNGDFLIVEYPIFNLSQTQFFYDDNANEKSNDDDDDLFITWTTGLDQYGNTIVQVDDLILLQCNSSNNDEQHNFQLIEVATMEQIRATSARHIIDYDKVDYYSNNNQNSWYIPRFASLLLRYDFCQFSLYHSMKKEMKQHAAFTGVSSFGSIGDNDSDDNNIIYEYDLLAVSDYIDLQFGTYRPSAIHIAFSNDPTEMIINFVTGCVGIPIVVYNNNVNDDRDYESVIEMMMNVTGISDTYTTEMLCQSPANSTEPGKFQSPGQLHTVKLSNLIANTNYRYRVGIIVEGRSKIVWSDTYNFTSALPISYESIPFSYIVYGDQGCSSSGWNDGSQYMTAMARREIVIPSLSFIEQEETDNTTATSANKDTLRLPVRAVHHIGDLSYAQGAAHQWDGWFDMIQSFTSMVPLMVAVGNHEYDHTAGGQPKNKDPSGVITDHGFMPEWGNFGDDSGGECGIPTSKRFTMPQQKEQQQQQNKSSDHVNSTTLLPSNGVFWYSHDFGNVHTTVVSSEHNLSVGSIQHMWLEQDLLNVNRSITPWIVVETHRPLYESENNWASNQVGIGMRYEFEDLLHKYQVDLVVAGHYHAYLRSCDNLYRSICYEKDDSSHKLQGPMHITVGTAGAHLDENDLYDNPWTVKFINGIYGYGRITVMNASAMHFEFIEASKNETDSGNVLDDVWIIRNR